MLEIRKKLLYQAFGLNVSSDLEFPELKIATEQTEPVDVDITLEDITGQYEALSDGSGSFVVRPGAVMFRLADLATFCIEDGTQIKVALVDGADEDELRLLLLGTCMGAILMQRRIYPLHGSAIAIDGKAYAIVGDSGAGKSTLASAFMERGYSLLSDDVIAVSLSQDGTPYVTPSYPQQKLWQDSLNRLGMESGRYRSVYGRVDKFCVPVSSRFYADSLPLAGVFELVKTDDPQIQLSPIGKLGRFHTLFCHTYRNFLIAPSGLTDWHFTMSAAIVNRIRMFQLRRPNAGFTAPQLVAQILQTVQTEHKEVL